MVSAGGVHDILLTSALAAAGYDSNELTRLCRQHELVRVRRGAYVRPPAEPLTPEDRHRQLIASTLPQLRSEAAFCHLSAAVLHGLPVWPVRLDQVHLARSRGHGGKRRALVHLHGGRLEEGDIAEVDGYAVTSLSRTVVDLARTLPMTEAVAAGDRALLQLDASQLDDRVARMQGWPGMRQARRALVLLDARSESPGESASRVLFHTEGVPPPQSQLQVDDDLGRMIARCDFGWVEHRTVGEFDGAVKYGRLLKPGQTVADVVLAEKRREDRLRDHGWQVVRWTWADLHQPGLIRDRLERAFARARRA